MKAFHFRLDPALRWRETQVNLQKARVAGAVAQLAGIETNLEAQRSALSNASTRICIEPTGSALQAFAAFKDTTRTRVRDLEAQAAIAQKAVTLEMNRLIEANQKVQLLDNLKSEDRTRWQQAFDRELAAFADEAFLSRRQSLQSK